jgi:hypothetical protein
VSLVYFTKPVVSLFYKTKQNKTTTHISLRTALSVFNPFITTS